MRGVALVLSFVFFAVIVLMVGDTDGEDRAREDLLWLELQKVSLEDSIAGLTFRADFYRRNCAEYRESDEPLPATCLDGDNGGLERWDSNIRQLSDEVSSLNKQMDELSIVLR